MKLKMDHNIRQKVRYLSVNRIILSFDLLLCMAAFKIDSK